MLRPFRRIAQTLSASGGTKLNSNKPKPSVTTTIDRRCWFVARQLLRCCTIRHAGLPVIHSSATAPTSAELAPVRQARPTTTTAAPSMPTARSCMVLVRLT